MTPPEKQTTSTLLMIRPANFGFNEETFETCPFQKRMDLPEKEVQNRALNEFDRLADKLKSEGVNIIVAHDTPEPEKPDAIFPNNWVSFHENSTVVLYPMLAPIRRLERRTDILASLKKNHQYSAVKICDFTSFEKKGEFLEGTGSMVLDRANKTAYACLSPRTHLEPLEKFAEIFGYKTVTFHTKDKLNRPIYHTNVVISVGEKYAVACLEAVSDRRERKQLSQNLKETGHTLIPITLDQMYRFCGNILQIENKLGEPLTVMSQQAFEAFTKKQLGIIEKYTSIVTSPAETIETVSGGSVRCMMAEVFPPFDSLHKL